MPNVQHVRSGAGGLAGGWAGGRGCTCVRASVRVALEDTCKDHKHSLESIKLCVKAFPPRSWWCTVVWILCERPNRAHRTHARTLCNNVEIAGATLRLQGRYATGPHGSAANPCKTGWPRSGKQQRAVTKPLQRRKDTLGAYLTITVVQIPICVRPPCVLCFAASRHRSRVADALAPKKNEDPHLVIRRDVWDFVPRIM